MTDLPIFPLQSVLLPGMPLGLHVFEPRYLAMFERVLAGSGEFGVVLIERGPEVGGGDRRFSRGTVAHVRQCRVGDGQLAVVAEGGARFEVDAWLPDDPYPGATVRQLPDLAWSPDLAGVREDAERAVRHALAVASEFQSGRWSPDLQLDADPVVSAWQLAGIAPLGPLDHLALLGSTSLGELLQRLARMAADAEETFALAVDDLDFPFEEGPPAD